jgi:hypothetical protein
LSVSSDNKYGDGGAADFVDVPLVFGGVPASLK